ncbi:MAG: restriction endonuclease subunit S [Nitrosomonas sp.]|uniref:restriction endonuclease subunit S n=1 Tax=Nitrosomonas sp. TaxID=42353 RepID=UPI002B3F2B70|nr:restriction endonuclease subunit S [Nitrosomonas sp.]MEB2331130.1 restriction endonuclease subunit S [Nitrosomonas sp.]HRQ05812.1 restriction endonuclease subunit S [Nitrosomonas halophila]
MAGKWPYKRVEEIALKVAMGPFGSSIKVETFTDTGIPIISGQHLRDAELTDSEFNFITEEHADSLKNANVQRGDVIFTHAGNIGQVAFIPNHSKYQRYVISQRQFYLRCDTSIILPEFVVYYFKSPEGQHKLLANANQVGVPSIARPSSYLKTIEVPVPSIEEQQVVVRNIKALDVKIRANRRINQTLEAMAQAVFKSWFVDFDPVKARIAAIEQGQDPLRAAMRAISGKTDLELDQMPREPHDQLTATAALFPDAMEESELGDIPKGWAAGKLAELCQLNPESWSAKSLPNVVRYVDLANAKNGEIAEVQNMDGVDIPSRARRILRQGDTIVGTVRPGNRSFALVGEANLTGSTGFAVLRPHNPHWLEFVYLVATSESNIERLTHLADGGAYPAVRPEVVIQEDVAIPTQEVAKAFHQHVQPLFAKIQANRGQALYLAQLRDTLLPKILSGQLRILDAEAIL